MINKFLARSDEEFELFTQMDEERYQSQPQYYNSIRNEEDDEAPLNIRLMTEE